MASTLLRKQVFHQAWHPRFEGAARPTRFIHGSPANFYPRRRQFFTSNANFAADNASENTGLQSDGQPAPTQSQLAATRRKNTRTPPGKTSLRKIAVEAQRSRKTKRKDDDQLEDVANSVTAISVADHFDMEKAVQILRSHGFVIDPDETGFSQEEVVHTRGVNDGDIFVFPSGSLVAWSLPQDVVSNLATRTLLPAAVTPHLAQMEMEDMEYKEDASRENSFIKGDMITLGTKVTNGEPDSSANLDTTLAKIAFSSGLARSTKLAVLETMLSRYFESTRTIPTLMSKGKLPFDRRFVMQKTGELLELRAQLNHYSELTDSLPDLFWDSRYDLGLEGYYDQVGKALDVGVRIKILNEKMDYAQEIATILRETLSEKHGSKLEWIIIVLITVEVGFELRRVYNERLEYLEKEALI